MATLAKLGRWEQRILLPSGEAANGWSDLLKCDSCCTEVLMQELHRENDAFIAVMQSMLVLRKEAMATIETARRGER